MVIGEFQAKDLASSSNNLQELSGKEKLNRSTVDR